MPKDRKGEAERQQRRNEVMKLYRQGHVQRDIAAQLNISQATVQRDIAAQLKEWREEMKEVVDDAVTRQLLELRQIRTAAWTQFEKEPAKPWLDAITASLSSEAKLLGLHRPERHEVIVRDWRHDTLDHVLQLDSENRRVVVDAIIAEFGSKEDVIEGWKWNGREKDGNTDLASRLFASVGIPI